MLNRWADDIFWNIWIEHFFLFLICSLSWHITVCTASTECALSTKWHLMYRRSLFERSLKDLFRYLFVETYCCFLTILMLTCCFKVLQCCSSSVDIVLSFEMCSYRNQSSSRTWWYSSTNVQYAVRFCFVYCVWYMNNRLWLLRYWEEHNGICTVAEFYRSGAESFSRSIDLKL